MLIRLTDFLHLNKDKVINVDIKEYQYINNDYIRRLKNVKGTLVFYIDATDKLSLDYHLKGVMVCPCAITLEDVEVPFDIEDNDFVTFNQNEEGYYLPKETKLDDLIGFMVFPEAPIKVVKKGKIDYPRGDDYIFEDEESYKLNKTDSRLSILKDMISDKEEE